MADPECGEQQPTLPALGKLPLRAKTSSQFPTKLLSLPDRLDNVETKLSLIRKGRGLFQLLKEAEIEKVCGVIKWNSRVVVNFIIPQEKEINLRFAKEAEAKLRDWKEGVVCQELDPERMPTSPLLDHNEADYFQGPTEKLE